MTLIFTREEHVARLLGRNLRRSGHTVLIVKTARMALDALMTKPIDRIILDPSIKVLKPSDLILWINENKPHINVHVLELP